MELWIVLGQTPSLSKCKLFSNKLNLFSAKKNFFFVKWNEIRMPPYQICQWRSLSGFMLNINFSLNIPMHEKAFSTFMFSNIQFHIFNEIQESLSDSKAGFHILHLRHSIIRLFDAGFHILHLRHSIIRLFEAGFHILHLRHSIIRLFEFCTAAAIYALCHKFSHHANLLHVGYNVPA